MRPQVFLVSCLACVEALLQLSKLIGTRSIYKCSATSSDRCCKAKLRKQFPNLRLKDVPVESFDVDWTANWSIYPRKSGHSSMSMRCQDTRKDLQPQEDRELQEVLVNYCDGAQPGYFKQEDLLYPRIVNGQIVRTTQKGFCVPDSRRKSLARSRSASRRTKQRRKWNLSDSTTSTSSYSSEKEPTQAESDFEEWVCSDTVQIEAAEILVSLTQPGLNLASTSNQLP